MRIRMSHHAIFKGAGLVFIDVADDVPWKGKVVRNGFPFQPCRKTGPSAALKVCIDDDLLDFFWRIFLESHCERFVTTALPILVDRGYPVWFTILEDHLRNHSAYLAILGFGGSALNRLRMSSIFSGVRGPYALPLINMAGDRSQ